MDEMHDPFTDQVECARYRAERDALAQRMEEIASEIDRTLLGVEGIEDAPAMRWARGLREALGALHSPRTSYEDIEAARWVREHGGVDECERKTIASIEVGESYTSLLIDLAEVLGCGYEEIYDSGGVLDDEDAGEHLVEAIKVKCYLADETARTVTGKTHGKSTPNDILAELRKRLMPEGMEWPTVDGRKVDFKTPYQPSLGVLEAVSIYSNGACEVMSHDGIIKPVSEIHVVVLAADGEPLEVGQTVWDENGDEFRVLDLYGCPVDEDFPDHTVRCRRAEAEDYESTMCEPSQLTHQRPVLDADGATIREGDTVWNATTGAGPLTVREIERSDDPDEPEDIVWCGEHAANGFKVWRIADQLTHTKPERDSWERIEADCSMADIEYCDEHGLLDPSCNADEGEAAERHCIDCGCTCGEKMARDLVRRCKALAERERGE